MLCVAIPLAAVDLFVKATIPTEPWAYHERSIAWLFLSFALFGGMIVVARIPSLLVAPAAGILAAGVLGNGLSAAWNGMEVPNPLLAGSDSAFSRSTLRMSGRSRGSWRSSWRSGSG